MSAQPDTSPHPREPCPDGRDLSWIVDRVRGRCDASAIYLFGSHAKRGPRPQSDIDLLIVAPSRLPRMRRGREVAAALAVFPRRFDLLFYTEQELAEECEDPYSFISSVMSSARPLYVRGEPTPAELRAPRPEPARFTAVESLLQPPPAPPPAQPEAEEPVLEPFRGPAWWEDDEPVPQPTAVEPTVLERSEPAVPAGDPGGESRARPSGPASRARRPEWVSHAGGPLRIVRALRRLFSRDA